MNPGLAELPKTELDDVVVVTTGEALDDSTAAFATPGLGPVSNDAAAADVDVTVAAGVAEVVGEAVADVVTAGLMPNVIGEPLVAEAGEAESPDFAVENAGVTEKPPPRAAEVERAPPKIEDPKAVSDLGTLTVVGSDETGFEAGRDGAELAADTSCLSPKPPKAGTAGFGSDISGIRNPPKAGVAAPPAVVGAGGLDEDDPKATGAAGFETGATETGFCATEASLNSKTGFGVPDEEEIGVDANGLAAAEAKGFADEPRKCFEHT